VEIYGGERLASGLLEPLDRVARPPSGKYRNGPRDVPKQLGAGPGTRNACVAKREGAQPFGQRSGVGAGG